MYAFLALSNGVVWAWALLTFGAHPLSLGTCILAYSLGLRHAVDADHIAAIDNVTRRLMQSGQRPYSVGLWFSLGHSTVVVVAALAVASAAAALTTRFEALRDVGSLAGTGISAVFLFSIAIANLFTLSGLYHAFRAAQRGETVTESALTALTTGGGLLSRLVRPLFRLIDKPWKMYPLGFLFGLGFDTASQIALLGIAVQGTVQDTPPWHTLAFPALFAASMSLVDTLDSTLMVKAYGWAFLDPMRKLYYNLVMTLVSVLVALVIGAMELLSMLVERFALKGPVWDAIGGVSEHSWVLGCMIAGIFLLTWGASATLYRLHHFDGRPIGE